MEPWILLLWSLENHRAFTFRCFAVSLLFSFSRCQEELSTFLWNRKFSKSSCSWFAHPDLGQRPTRKTTKRLWWNFTTRAWVWLETCSVRYFAIAGLDFHFECCDLITSSFCALNILRWCAFACFGSTILMFVSIKNDDVSVGRRIRQQFIQT